MSVNHPGGALILIHGVLDDLHSLSSETTMDMSAFAIMLHDIGEKYDAQIDVGTMRTVLYRLQDHIIDDVTER